MDYRNADGSLAEMCGNGIRVFARYLVAAGLTPAGTFAIATRAGLRTVELGEDPDGEVTVDMGPARVGPEAMAILPSTVGPAGSVTSFAGVAVDVGNPHLACVTTADLDALDLTGAPGYDAEVFPDGVNVEFLTPLYAGAPPASASTSAAPARPVPAAPGRSPGRSPGCARRAATPGR